MDKHNRLLTIALILALLLLAVTGYALVYSVSHKSDLEQRISNRIDSEVSKIKPQKGDAGISVEGARGLQGYPGLRGDAGAQGLQGNMGIQGQQGVQGITGEPGASGAKGDPGQPGQAGREVEFRCDPDTDNYQWRYVGDEGWTNIQENSNTCKSSLL